MTLLRRHPGQKPLLGQALVDPESEVTQGLVHAWIGSGGGGFSDTVGPAHAYYESGAGNAITALGSGVTSTGAGTNGGGATYHGIILTPVFTYEAWFLATNFTNGAVTVMGTEESAFAVLIRLGDSGLPNNQAQFVIGNSKANGTRQLPVNTLIHAVATYDGFTQRLYINGTLDASVTATTAIPTGGGYFGFGTDEYAGSHYGGARTLPGTIPLARYWNRALSPAEVASLYADPYAPLQPARRVWATGAAAALVSATTTGQGGSTGALATPASVAAPGTARGGAAGVVIPSIGTPATGRGGAQGGAAPLLAEPTAGQAGAGGSVSPAVAPPAATTAAGGQGLASPTIPVPTTAGGGTQGSASPVVTTPATGQGGAAGSAVASGQATGSAVGMAGAAGVASPTVSSPPATGGGGAQAATTPTIGGAPVAGQAGDQSAVSAAVAANATGQGGGQGADSPTVTAAGGGSPGGAQGAAASQTMAPAAGQGGASGTVTGATVAQPAPGQGGGQGMASGVAQALGAATGQAGAGGSVSPSVRGPAAGGDGSQGSATGQITAPALGQAGDQGSVAPSTQGVVAGQNGAQGVAAPTVATTSLATPVRLRAAAAWRSHAAAAAWRSHTYSLQLGGPVTLTPLTPDAAGLNPGDANSPLTVRVDGLPQGAVIAAVSAAATVRALGLSGAQPAPTFIRAPAPTWTGNVVTLTIGDGAGINGALYLLDIGVQVGAEWQHGALAIACGRTT